MEDKKLSSLNCNFCSRNKAIYICPRCNAAYCSKICYQSEEHIDCSEQFYKECIEEELKLGNGADASQRQMSEILSRLKDNFQDDDLDGDTDSDDENSIPDLSERLENVDLNDANKVWDCLTDQERSEFQTILNSGNITHLLPEYEPWWCKRFEKKIEELDAFLNKENQMSYTELCPIVKEIPPFNSVSKVSPSPYIIWNIVNVLSSYSFIVRRYIGEHYSYSSQVMNAILDLSTNLKSNQNFDTKATAIESVIYHANNIVGLSCSKEEANMVYDDIENLLLGPENSKPGFYMLSALCDLQRLFSEAATQKNATTKNGEFSKKYPSVPPKAIEKKQVHRCVKKLDFYLSWINEYYQKI